MKYEVLARFIWILLSMNEHMDVNLNALKCIILLFISLRGILGNFKLYK